VKSPWPSGRRAALGIDDTCQKRAELFQYKSNFCGEFRMEWRRMFSISHKGSEVREDKNQQSPTNTGARGREPLDSGLKKILKLG